MKRPAKARPSYTEEPTPYKQGKIYFSKSKQAFRVYLKKTDRVDKAVKIQDQSKKRKNEAFQYACALIETDSR